MQVVDFQTRKKGVRKVPFSLKSGERGIRTPGTSQCDGFQDRCNRPLYHLSNARLVQKAGAKVRFLIENGERKIENYGGIKYI